MCEVTAQRSLLNFAIIQDIPFDVGQVIEDAILHNRIWSTASSSHRIWRRCVLTCAQFWPIRPSSYSSSRLCRPSLLSSWRSTSHPHLHRSDVQGSSLTLSIFILPVGTLDLLFGGGGNILFGYYVFIFCLLLIYFRCFGFSSL